MSKQSRKRRWKKSLLVVLAASILLLIGIGAALWDQLARRGPSATFSDPAEHFKYGSLGQTQGFPYYLWAVIPDIFADKFPQPGGWKSFGFIDEGRGYPVGFSLQTVGFPGLSPNCALCHSGTYRTSDRGKPVLVPGAPAGGLRFDAFNRFIFEIANDARFNAETLMPEIGKRFKLGAFESWVYRTLLIPEVRKSLQQQASGAAWMATRPTMGPGRFDAFNLFKISLLKMPDDGSIGTADYPSLWNQRIRDGMYVHWNGSGNDIRAEHLLSAYPVNMGAHGFLPRNFEKLHSYIATLSQPAFPFPVNLELAQAGRKEFETYCSECHAIGGARTGKVTPQSEIGTDAMFLKVWSPAFVERLRKLDDVPFRFPSLRITNGYANMLLDGVWMRAPYLHNGSVPTLWDLLQPANRRPMKFNRGDDVYDPIKLGFRHAPGNGVPFDVLLPGNSNAGHEFGVDLSESRKRALIEFLKTL